MDLSNISSKSTKRQIWEAYQAILGEMASRKQPAAQDNAALTELPPVLESEEQKILARASELKAEAVTNDLNNIKASSAEMLDRLSEKLIGELKKLETVKQAVVLENHNLESLYKIKAEADTLLDLIALREQKRDDFQKTLAEEEEKLKFEIEQKRKQASREDEEYAHKLKLTRQKEQGDYEFKN